MWRVADGGVGGERWIEGMDRMGLEGYRLSSSWSRVSRLSSAL